MDVRCDRCQTEYELDDASVAESGASVQCTTCGHTFVVGRGKLGSKIGSKTGRKIGRGTPPPVPQPDRPVTPTPSWMLTTEEGKTHRFRDSQTLQKWVVERRVTRADRVCPPAAPGGASATSTSCGPSSTSWRRLIGRPPPLGARAPHGQRRRAPRRSSRPYVSADFDDDDVLGGKTRRPVVSGAFNDDISTDDDLAMAGIGARHPGRKLLIGLVVVFVGLAAYLGFRGTAGLHLPGIGPASPPSAAPPVAPARRLPLPPAARAGRRAAPAPASPPPAPVAAAACPCARPARRPAPRRLRRSPRRPPKRRPRRAPRPTSSRPVATRIRGATST